MTMTNTFKGRTQINAVNAAPALAVRRGKDKLAAAFEEYGWVISYVIKRIFRITTRSEDKFVSGFLGSSTWLAGARLELIFFMALGKNPQNLELAQSLGRIAPY